MRCAWCEVTSHVTWAYSHRTRDWVTSAWSCILQGGALIGLYIQLMIGCSEDKGSSCKIIYLFEHIAVR